MTLNEVGFYAPTIEKLKSMPIIGSNFNNIESDFTDTFSKLLASEQPEGVEASDLLMLKTSLFEAFALGAQSAILPSSRIRLNFTTPEGYTLEGETKVVGPEPFKLTL